MSTSPGPSSGRPAAGARRRQRERALGLLYEAEAKQLSPEAVLAELPARPEPYAAALVAGVSRRQSEIDALIGAHARDWGVDRMPAIDRQLLRLSVFELLESADVPVAVVIDEAVELAKLYSTADAGRFVNGVLSAVAGEVRAPVSA